MLKTFYQNVYSIYKRFMGTSRTFQLTNWISLAAASENIAVNLIYVWMYIGRNGDIKLKITACGLKPRAVVTNNNFSAFSAGESAVWTDRRVIKFLMDFTWLTAHRKHNFKVKLNVHTDDLLLRCALYNWFEKEYIYQKY